MARERAGPRPPPSLRDGGGLLEGDERAQALDDAAGIGDLAQQSGVSAIDKQVIEWLTSKLAQAKDLITAERITVALTVIMLSMQWSA